MSCPTIQAGRADLLRLFALHKATTALSISTAVRLLGYRSRYRSPGYGSALKNRGQSVDNTEISQVLRKLESVQGWEKGDNSSGERFWYLHKRQKLVRPKRLDRHSPDALLLPPELRKIRPLPLRELHFPNFKNTRPARLSLKPLKRKKKRSDISRHVNMVALLRPQMRHDETRIDGHLQASAGKFHPHLLRLLALLSPAEQVEPQLLQALIRLLPAAAAGGGLEHAVRFHPDVQLNKDRTSSLVVRPEKRAAYLKLFQGEDTILREKVFYLLHRHHSKHFPALLALELIRADQFLCTPSKKIRHEWLEQFMLRLARTWLEQKEDSRISSYAAHVVRQLPKSFCEQYTWPAFLYGIAHRNRLKAGSLIPRVYNSEAVMNIVRKSISPTGYLLVQEGEGICLVQGPDVGICLLKGSRIAWIELSSDSLLLYRENQAEIVPVQTGRPIYFLDGKQKQFHLRTSEEILYVKAHARPSWAHLIGRNSRELFAEIPWQGRNYRLYWQIPESGGKGRWKGYHGPVGMDSTGLYADFGMGGTVVQRFRWIDPGSFIMGSPKDEPERESWGRETQHEVTLTKGFWLADTAVTQRLWLAVMKDNPARFKGNSYPVENVNWNDIQHFLTRLNQLIPAFSARLPTEAEWEYACRAGTSTPFSCGGKITPGQSNYNSNYPYNKGVKGIYRQQTVAVKSLPSNAWGLYEMHGNVWEWCRDYWQEDLLSEPLVDPCGPENGDFRIVRGGSWFLNGRGVRSAIRGRFSPEFGNDRIGFRLALNHKFGAEDIASMSGGCGGR